MMRHSDFTEGYSGIKTLYLRIKQGEVWYAGNRKLRIYGLLTCTSGKRMNRQNRIFFKTRAEAEKEGYRPCAQCMHQAFITWRSSKK